MRPRNPSELRSVLQAVVSDLERIHSTVAVTVAALKQQASGIDQDIASVLERGAGDLLQEQVERLQCAMGLLAGSSP